MKKKSVILILSIIVLLAAVSGVVFFLYQRYYFTLTVEPERFGATDRALDNPYQGWYQIFGYALSDETPPDLNAMERTAAAYPHELVLLEINLRDYNASAISEQGLTQLSDILSLWQSHGNQLILRFLYDWNGKAKETEPSDVSVILQHMDQTAAVVNQYTDCVYLLQGIYVGNCGEMNNSNYMAAETMCMLAEHLAAVTDPAIFLSVRTPAHWRAISGTYEALKEEEAFSGSVSARLGLFNDGMLGSASDLGTYGENSIKMAEKLTDKGTREEEIAFQNTLCNYVPNGGEVVLDNPLNDFANAVTDLAAMHVSYLDCGYDAAVLDKWRASTYEGDDCFAGTNGYDYIGSHMGYRYDLLSAALSFDTFHDKTANLSLTLQNSGFSAGYRAFTPTAFIVSASGGLLGSYPFETDTRTWLPGETVTLNAPIDIRALGEGRYYIYFQLYDETLGRHIKLSNTLRLSENGYLILSFTVAK